MADTVQDILVGLNRIEERLSTGLAGLQEELSVGRGFLEAVDETYRARQAQVRRQQR